MPELDETVKDDVQEVKPTVAPTLEQVHAISKAKIEEEDEDEHVEDGKEITDEEDTKDVDDKAGERDSGGNEVDDDTTVTTKDEPVVESAPELDLDILKPGTGKVPIKDSEGKTYYFNSLDEVPSDFEPATYKELMVGVDALRDKRDTDRKTATDAQIEADKQAHQKQTEALQKNWDKDADALVESGAFPKDTAKLEKAKNEVYDYIEAEMKQGNIITSFNQAYKGMMYDKQVAADKKKQADLDKAKKDRGSIVQGGGGGSGETPSARGNKIVEAPPSGVGLDAVHARALRSL